MAQGAVNLMTHDDAAGNVSSCPASPARCLRCAADLSQLPDRGRYCPQCGLDSYSSAPAAIVMRAAESLPAREFDFLGWGHLAELARPGLGAVCPPMVALPNSSSQMLRGYANALYNLGRRYEVSLAQRNPREAIRCYFKAARLGNLMAYARLATRWIERCDQAERGTGSDSPAVDAAGSHSSFHSL